MALPAWHYSIIMSLMQCPQVPGAAASLSAAREQLVLAYQPNVACWQHSVGAAV